VGDNGTILHTSDGGLNWTKQKFTYENNSLSSLSGVCFVDTNIGWAVGDCGGGGLIIHTSTGGIAP